MATKIPERGRLTTTAYNPASKTFEVIDARAGNAPRPVNAGKNGGGRK